MKNYMKKQQQNHVEFISSTLLHFREEPEYSLNPGCSINKSNRATIVEHG